MSALTGDAQYMAGFQREAQVLASLHHPHIAILHGLQECDGALAVVMELVEGPTLAERIVAGPIPVAEALPIARQIADALEEAHERGIEHRDLTPANVKFTGDGAVNAVAFADNLSGLQWDMVQIQVPQALTDFVAKLVDVYPDGRAYNVAEGVLRARYRESLSRPARLEPGKIYEMTIDLVGTSNAFLKGHRMRVDLTSSHFPQFDRNPNTGEPFGMSAAVKVARQTIHHSKTHPSYVVLPVIPQ